MKKKFFAVFSTCLMLSSMSNVAMAGNISDTSFSLTLTTTSETNNTPYGYTEGRAKRDATSTYVKLTTTPPVGRVRCMVQGDNEKLGTMIWYNRNIGGKEVILTNGEWQIKQTVYESGDSNARLRFQLYAGNPGKAIGVWSPDSVGSYQLAN